MSEFMTLEEVWFFLVGNIVDISNNHFMLAVLGLTSVFSYILGRLSK